MLHNAVKSQDDKPEAKDLRTNPPTKVKLPVISRPSPPPVKEKPNRVSPHRTNGDVAPLSPKQVEEIEGDQFDGVDVQTEKLSHPTANRAKPPQRRPPTAQVTATQGSENLLPSPAKPDPRPKTPPPTRPAPPKVVVDLRAAASKEKPTLESLQAEIRELRTALELLQTQHSHDMKEVNEELQKERNKRQALQEEVNSFRMKQ